jgi:hypothetical protein
MTGTVVGLLIVSDDDESVMSYDKGERFSVGLRPGRTLTKEQYSGPFLACPKVYEISFADFSNRNCLISVPLLDQRVVYGQRLGKGSPDVPHP